jgi:SPP1 gp7 family putative phage head morphogenesis protein
MSFDESEYWDFSPEPTESEFQTEKVEPVFNFITAADERVCPQCGPLDGQVFTASEVESNFPDASELFPGTVAANVHINCRCQLIGEPMDESATDSLGSSEEFFGGEY